MTATDQYPIKNQAPAVAPAVVPHGVDADGNAVVLGAQSSTTVQIASGAALTNAIDLGNARLAGIAIPSGWTTANLTFQVSADGVTYSDFYDYLGGEYTAQVGGTSRFVGLPLADFLAIRYLKIRSGTTGTPVAQAALRTLTLSLVS